MAQKTYLQLVNSVLRRVRETQVGTVTENAYSTLIGEYINDAKQVVEDAWNWACLRKVINFTLSAGTYTYDLSQTAIVGAGNELSERSKIINDPYYNTALAVDNTTGNPYYLRQYDIEWVNRQFQLMSTHPDVPFPSVFALTTTSTGVVVNLLEKPSVVRNWQMVFKNPQVALAGDSDALLVPYQPVVLLATNYALQEKGEEIGQPGNEAEKKYLNSLADAIALDSSQSPHSLTFWPD